MTDFYEKLADAVGREVIASSVGHGSFIDIEFSGACAAAGRLQLWVYMAEWALLEDDAEIVASDMSDDDFANKKPLLANLVGKMATHVVTFEEEGEFRIGFSGDYRLEIWAAPAVYGREAPIARLYSDGQHISDLVLNGEVSSG